MQSQAQNPRPRISEEYLHKNRLQEYAQKSGMPLPVYNTVNQGPPHLPNFQSTVQIDGSSYTSQTFSQRKEAEQDAAKVALSHITKKIQDEGCPLINEDLTFCKSIVNEFAAKMDFERPTYETVEIKGLLPSFVSTAVFHGKTYTAIAGKNKKEAEQLAAREVIQALLGTELKTMVCEIVNSKKKLCATYKAGASSASEAGPLSGQPQEFTTPETSRATRPLKKPKLEQFCDPSVSIGNVVPLTNLTPNVDTGLAGNQGTFTSDGKLPHKNKRKAQGGMKKEGSARSSGVPIVQTAQCSVRR